MADTDKALSLYDDVARGWVLKVIKNPMLSMLRDPTLDLDFTNPKVPLEERAERLMKAKVRAKGIFEGLREHLKPKEIPGPLILFLASLFKTNAYPPDNFLTEFELNRVRLDKYGAFIDMKDPHVKMLMCFYLVQKVLVAKVLLKPKALNLECNEIQKNNFKLVASIIHHTFMEYLMQLTSLI